MTQFRNDVDIVSNHFITSISIHSKVLIGFIRTIFNIDAVSILTKAVREKCL
jgi:hypothetical protein